MKLFVLLGLAAVTGLLPLGASGDENLTINVILPLTGPAAFVGQDEKAAMQIYETMINKAGGRCAARKWDHAATRCGVSRPGA
jgi:hypothetical protein